MKNRFLMLLLALLLAGSVLAASQAPAAISEISPPTNAQSVPRNTLQTDIMRDYHEFKLNVGETYTFQYPKTNNAEAFQRGFTLALTEISRTNECPSAVEIRNGNVPPYLGMPQAANIPCPVGTKAKLVIQFQPATTAVPGTYSLGLNERLRLMDNYVLEFFQVEGQTAHFRLYKMAPATVVSSNSSETIQIGIGETMVSIRPTKVTAVSETGSANPAQQPTTAYEIPSGIREAAEKAIQVTSVTINSARAVPIQAEVVTSAGSVLQEFPDGQSTSVQYKGTEIVPDTVARETRIKQENVVVSTPLKLEISDNQLYAKTDTLKEAVNILPVEASQRMRENKLSCESLSLTTANEKTVYQCNSPVTTKILGLFPVQYTVTALVNATNGTVRIERPWWSFAAFS